MSVLWVAFGLLLVASGLGGWCILARALDGSSGWRSKDDLDEHEQTILCVCAGVVLAVAMALAFVAALG